MPRLEVPDDENTRALIIGARQAHETWRKGVEEERRRLAAAEAELQRNIESGLYQPDLKNNVRIMKRPDLSKKTGLTGWFKQLIGGK